MTAVEEIPAPVEADAPRRWWDRVPFAAHAALLAVVLLATGWMVGPRASFLPDEGAVILQARILSTGHGWFEKPALLKAVDPAGDWYPLDNADQSVRGFAPFAKHPAYAVLTAGAYRVAGVPGIIFLSMVGTFAAALLSAALARRFAERFAVPTLWVVGLVSPLFFDAFMAVATTIAAALGAVAVLAAATLLGPERARPARVGAATVAVAAGIGLAVLMRSEALVMAIALALVLGAMAVVQRRLSLAFPAAASLAGGFVARVAEAKLRGHVLGAATPAAVLGVQGSTLPGQSFLGARIAGFNNTWLQASHFPIPLADVSLTVMWVVAGALALIVRREKVDRGAVGVLTGCLLVAAVARLLVTPLTPVPGLLLAFPLLWAGILLLGRQDWTPLGALTLGTAALFGVGVIGTQYSVGGSLEWGGRYFAMGLPIVVPAVLVALHRRGTALEAGIRRLGTVALVGVSVVMTVLAGLSLRSQHVEIRHLAGAVVTLSPPTTSGPVVVTNVAWVARLAWTAYDGRDWLYVPYDQFGRAADRLQGAGRDQVTLVTVGPDCRADAFPGYRIVAHRSVSAHGRLWQVATLRRGPGPSDCAPALTSG